MKSMTGFGESHKQEKDAFVSVEVSSVNNRHRDVKFSLDDHIKLRKRVIDAVKQRIERGRIEVTVRSNILGKSEGTLEVNTDIVGQYLDFLDDLETKPAVSNGSVGATDLLGLPGVVTLTSIPSVSDQGERLLMQALDEALDEMIAMREKEGLELKRDLETRIGRIEECMDDIEERFPVALQEYRDSLLERFDSLLDLDQEQLNDEIENEIKKYAEKCDISEEVTRIKSHLKQFRSFLEQNEPVGKNLKFLLQEIQREINTVGAKANDAEVSHLAVDVKSELEKCREQIHNVE